MAGTSALWRGMRCIHTEACPCLAALRGRRRCQSQLLCAVVFATYIVGPSGTLANVENGLLAEYFLNFEATCGQVNGSTDVLAGRVPNYTRVDMALFFNDRLAFNLKRCAYENNAIGHLKYVCRGSDESTKYFAARWTGYLMVEKAGMYSFKVEADDGARIIIGNGYCPSAVCGPWEETINLGFDSLHVTFQRDGTWAKSCPLCESGVYGDCRITDNGCEPFRQWQMEMDGGLNGPCSQGPRTQYGSRWLVPGLHPIRIEYFQRGGEAQFALQYSGPDADSIGAKGGYLPISARNFIFPNFKGLRADWFQIPKSTGGLPPHSAMGSVPGGKHLRTVDDDFVAHGPGEGWFSEKVFNDDVPVLIRWSGFMEITTAGSYTFELISDDGSRFIIAGRGGLGESIVVALDGMQDKARSRTAVREMMAGMHGIRIEYFYNPGWVGSVPNPPGIIVSYSGPDTANVTRPIATSMKSILKVNDAGCSMSNWRWGNGMSISRDCRGRCADNNQVLLGDGFCDKGLLLLGAPTMDFNCQAFNFDNSDCESRLYQHSSTPRPQLMCGTTCPAGDHRRNSCRSCANGVLANKYAPLCVETVAPHCEAPADAPDSCSNLECCVAHVHGIVSFGSDCIAFGAATNCTHQLGIMLKHMREEPPDLYSRAYFKEPPEMPRRPVPGGYLVSRCGSHHCNVIPDGFVENPRTGRPTEQRICPVGEVPAGLTCWVGPWDVTRVNRPREECENGNYKWNFCKDTKTHDGRPFVRCCTLAYVNAVGNTECRFLGLPFGDCWSYLETLKADLSTSTYTAIDSEQVLNDCQKDDCNDPEDKDKGCAISINKAPIQTAETNTPDPTILDREALMEGAVEAKGEGPPWLIIGLVSGCFLSFILIVAVTLHLLREIPVSPWYSSKAHVVAPDTWIEPDQDDTVNLTYGVVKPRPVAFNMLVRDQKEKEGHCFAPKALEDGGALSQVGPVPEALNTPAPEIEAGGPQLRHSATASTFRSGSMQGELALAIPSTRQSIQSHASFSSHPESVPSRQTSPPALASVAENAEAGEADPSWMLQDISREGTQGTPELMDPEVYDGITLPHVCEIGLNQRNPASLSRPPAADRVQRDGFTAANGKPQVYTVCT